MKDLVKLVSRLDRHLYGMRNELLDSDPLDRPGLRKVYELKLQELLRLMPDGVIPDDHRDWYSAYTKVIR